ncbi:hypothetical protein M0804_014758 [Polistes exclamans]|nr:hypothetical protein M0804_014759 [Polistes exclamans]KAI4474613.1 hypothetical protein M0804_014758 [Polistes exclamans]
MRDFVTVVETERDRERDRDRSRSRRRLSKDSCCRPDAVNVLVPVGTHVHANLACKQPSNQPTNQPSKQQR